MGGESRVRKTSNHSPQVSEDADIGANVAIGENSRVWGGAQLRDGVRIGKSCVIGRNCYIGVGVEIGDNSKIQNSALIYEPASIGAGVFIGPAVILTNDTFPRSINLDGSVKSASDWLPVGVTVADGASIGAGAVCVAPLAIGEYAMIGAGAVVSRDVGRFALVVGVPATQVGWVGRAGFPLKKDGELFLCPKTGERYLETNGELALDCAPSVD
jgi:UDP-2-acetamido-3-amino-2,3-dideoxy-glucuronate N-acetyltransferase